MFLQYMGPILSHVLLLHRSHHYRAINHVEWLAMSVPVLPEVLNEPQYDARHHCLGHTHQITGHCSFIHLGSWPMTITKSEIIIKKI
jgi:hypothetical protein